MNWIKIIFVNILIAFSLLGMLLLAPPILYSIYSIVSGNTTHSDKRAELDLYNDITWAERHFFEFSELSTTYYDFITWRRNEYIGETVNITNGVRATIGSQTQNNDIADYYFFGGSTTWGTGVNDANTYPSLIAQRTSTNVVNFGETGYIARQSLAYLNNFLINNSIHNMSGRHVVFYDGINDVANRCRSEINGLGTSREHQIQTILTSNQKYGFSKLFEQLKHFLQAVMHKLGIQSGSQLNEVTYSCSSNPDRAKEDARTLVQTWQAASNLVTRQGGNFTAILQPVAYIGNPNIHYLDLTSSDDLALGMQYEAVYPFIKQFAEARNLNFLDLTDVYNNCDNCYIDFGHVGPQAHQLLVERLVQNLQE